MQANLGQPTYLPYWPPYTLDRGSPDANGAAPDITLRCKGDNIVLIKALKYDHSAAFRTHQVRYAYTFTRPGSAAWADNRAGLFTAMSRKQRADVMLAARGLAESRARAQALIMAGKVFTGTRRVQKPGESLAEHAELEVRGQDHPWVSRGGLKLQHALDMFALSPQGLVCLDIGASTGGFTDVLLHNGALRVHAVDVGHGQLAWKLRADPRVVVHERTNARHLAAAQLGEPVEALVCDASFIGLRTVLPAPLALCRPGAWAVALIKPQFEAGPGQVGNKGVVRDPAVHAEVRALIESWWSALPGWAVIGTAESPITGPEGNKEFLIAARRQDRRTDS
jgi:23S rRNA (cytidine1920-2'-O)/16S rRNA (cytidine1409-2'-O)-methyltransferase